MTSIQSTVAVALVVSATYHAAAQVASFHAWLEAPAVVQAGDSFTVQLWVGAESELFMPSNYFSGVQCGFEVHGDLLAFQSLTSITTHLFRIPGTPDGSWLRDVMVWQANGVPGFSVDFRNPIPILTFDVQTTPGTTGRLAIDIRPFADSSDPLFFWTLEEGTSNWINTSDPGVTLTTKGTAIRVIPAPGAGAVLGLAGFAALRRPRRLP
jgi:hypothetical protein